jgi:mono/diheme cytochrome c family protein
MRRAVATLLLALGVNAFGANTFGANTFDAKAEEAIALKPGAGRDLVEGYCNACHSLDYPRINATFLNRQGWESEVNKMIKAYGAPIGPDDAKIIVDYLAANYGSDR